MIGFVSKNLSSFILKKRTPPVCRSPLSLPLSLSTSPETPSSTALFDILVYKHNFPPELASRVASESTHLRNPAEADSILSFFTESGFSNSQLAKIVRLRPRILAASLEDSILPRIRIFQDLGFSCDDICKLISWNSSLLRLSIQDNIVPSLSVWKGLLGSNIAVAKAFRKAPRFLNVNLASTVLPNVEFLKSCGIPMESIRIAICNFPCPFLAKPEVIRRSVEKAREMGVDAPSRTFLYAIMTIASMRGDTWEVKLQGFRDMGFSDSDIVTMFRKAPKMFLGSTERKMEVKRLLLDTGKFSVSRIVDYPLSLVFSVENRYKPRLGVLGVLESRGLIKEWPDLATFCQLSDAAFVRKFIGPYLDEVKDVDIIKKFIRMVQEAASLKACIGMKSKLKHNSSFGRQKS